MIGSPIAHSLSPRLHNAAFAALGLDWIYVAFEVAEGDAPRALDAMRALGVAGLSVTMPHKEAVALSVDVITDDAARLGAVNCVAHDGDSLIGSNTDGEGFLRAMRTEAGFEVAGRSCAIVGAGGAARAVVLACARAGASEVLVVNRSADRGKRAAELADRAGRVATTADLADVDLVVNATPVGMGDRAGALPFEVDLLRPDQVVADLVYDPSPTALVARARARGMKAIDGRGMLVHQAALAFETWTGRVAPLDVMLATLGGH